MAAMFNLLSLANIAAQPGLPARPIARCAEADIDRAQFLSDIIDWQAAFKAAPGTRWALYFNNSYTFACALFGAWHAGKTPVLPGDLQTETRQRLKQEVDGWAGDMQESIQTTKTSGTPHLPALSPLNTSLVVYTSGSNGQPLAIHKRLDQLQAEIIALEKIFGKNICQDSTVYATVSHQHIYGLLFQILWPLASGRRFAADRLIYAEDILRETSRQKSVLISSPTHLSRLPKHLEWSLVKANLQTVFSSGGPLSLDAAENTAQCLGCYPIEVYGSSETGGIAYRQRNQPTPAWQLLPGVEARIEAGCLMVKSAHLPKPMDWWPTEDRAEFDSANQHHPQHTDFTLLGRSDRIVKIGENRISLTIVEQRLAQTTWVKECRALVINERVAIVGLLTEVGLQFIVQQGTPAFNAMLRDYLSDFLVPVARPRQWRWRESFPLTAQGKFSEAELRKLFRPLIPPMVWQQRQETQALIELDIQEDLLAFDGHFPEMKILPGVAQLDWAITLGKKYFKIENGFSRIDGLKFPAPIYPNTKINLEIRWQVELNKMTFKYTSQQGLHTIGQFIFEI